MALLRKCYFIRSLPNSIYNYNDMVSPNNSSHWTRRATKYFFLSFKVSNEYHTLNITIWKFQLCPADGARIKTFKINNHYNKRRRRSGDKSLQCCGADWAVSACIISGQLPARNRLAQVEDLGKNGVHIRGLLLYACAAAHGGSHFLRYLACKYIFAKLYVTLLARQCSCADRSSLKVCS